MDLQTKGEDGGDEPYPAIAVPVDSAEEIRAGCGVTSDRKIVAHSE